MITVSLDYPPSANRLWRYGGKGNAYRSPEYVSWKEAASWAVQSAVRRQGNIEGAYFLEIAAKRPDRRKRDLDNLIKPISDALVTGGAVEDDSQCQFLHARWDDEVPSGVVVTVKPDPSWDGYVEARRQETARYSRGRK